LPPFGEAIPGERYPWFTEPSVIRLHDGRLTFGRKALAGKGGELWRSLKMRLLDPNGMLLDSSHSESPLTVDVIIAAHVANVLQRIWRALKTQYGDTHEIQLMLNIGAPMNHFVNAELHERYLQIMNAAWQVTFGESPYAIKNGVRIEEVVPLLCQMIALPVPDTTARPFEVLPETVAPIVSMSKDPSMDPGLYTMMDMGAGTTEMSVIFVSDSSSGHRVSCYFDESHCIGGNDLAVADNGGPQSADHHAEQIRKLLAKITLLAFQNDAPNPVLREKWENLKLLYTGGGSRHPAILRESSRMTQELKNWQIGEQYFDCGWHTPRFPRYESELSDTESSLLAVANGLSYHRKDWPIFYEPALLRPEAPLERIERPEAVWYVND